MGDIVFQWGRVHFTVCPLLFYRLLDIYNRQRQTSYRGIGKKIQEEKRTNEASHTDDKTGGAGDMYVFNTGARRVQQGQQRKL